MVRISLLELGRKDRSILALVMVRYPVKWRMEQALSRVRSQQSGKRLVWAASVPSVQQGINITRIRDSLSDKALQKIVAACTQPVGLWRKLRIPLVIDNVVLNVPGTVHCLSAPKSVAAVPVHYLFPFGGEASFCKKSVYFVLRKANGIGVVAVGDAVVPETVEAAEEALFRYGHDPCENAEFESCIGCEGVAKKIAHKIGHLVVVAPSRGIHDRGVVFVYEDYDRTLVV